MKVFDGIDRGDLLYLFVLLPKSVLIFALHFSYSFLFLDLFCLFLILCFFPLYNISPVHPLPLLIFILIIILKFECFFECADFRLGLLEESFVRLDIVSDRFIELRKLNLSSGFRGIGYTMGNYLPEVLEGWVEGELWLQLLLFLLGVLWVSRQIKRVDKLSSCRSLGICTGDKRRELVISNIFSCWELDHVENRLLLADVWVKYNKFRLCILSFYNFSY